LAVWFSALSTSWWSTLLTMSKDESAMARTLSDPPPRPPPAPAVRSPPRAVHHGWPASQGDVAHDLGTAGG
jgi:hypothetical protein